MENNISRLLTFSHSFGFHKSTFSEIKKTQHKIDTINAAARLRSNLIKRLKSLFFLFSPFVVICQVSFFFFFFLFRDFLYFTLKRNCNAKCNGNIVTFLIPSRRHQPHNIVQLLQSGNRLEWRKKVSPPSSWPLRSRQIWGSRNTSKLFFLAKFISFLDQLRRKKMIWIID